jgi:hypothetical protein
MEGLERAEESRDRAMSKYERRMWFERLCQLRDTYRATEQVSGLTIAEAIAYAERLFDDPQLPEVALADSSATAPTAQDA